MTQNRRTEHRVIITPPRRFALPNIRHLWEAREVLFRFGQRDITLRYRQTLLGVVWVILQPLLTALIFSLVFGKVAKLPSGGTPYLVFSFAGLLAWNVFNSVITRAAPSLVSNSALVSKVFFPRILVPLSTCYSVLVDFAVSFAFMGILLAAYGVSPGWGIFLIPVWLILMILLASSIGMVCSALMVRYRDVQYVVPFILQFLLYASPIAYAADAIPKKYQLIYDCNPLTWLLNEFRFSLLGQPVPPAWQIVLSFIVPIAIFAAGMLIFEQMERGFADVI